MIEEISNRILCAILDVYPHEEIEKHMNKDEQDLYPCVVHIYKQIKIRMDTFLPEETMMYTVEIHKDMNLYSYTETIEDSYPIGYNGQISELTYKDMGEYFPSDPFFHKGYTYSGYVVVHRDYFNDFFE